MLPYLSVLLPKPDAHFALDDFLSVFLFACFERVSRASLSKRSSRSRCMRGQSTTEQASRHASADAMMRSPISDVMIDRIIGISVSLSFAFCILLWTNRKTMRHRGWTPPPVDDWGNGDNNRRESRGDRGRSPRYSRDLPDERPFRDDERGRRPRDSPRRAYDDYDTQKDGYGNRDPDFRDIGQRDTPPRRSYFDGDISNVRLDRDDFSDLLEFRRVFYEVHPNVAARSAEEVNRVRQQMGITVQPRDICPPALTFEEAFSQGLS